MKRYYRLLTLIFAFAALPCKADKSIKKITNWAICRNPLK